MAESECITRTCNRCKEVKPEERFYRHPNGVNGRAAICVDCTKAAQKKYRAEKAEYHRARCKKYSQENAERLRECRRKYFSKNRDRVLETNRRSQMRNAEKHNERNRRHYQENKESQLAIKALWKKQNPDKVGEHYVRRKVSLKSAMPKWANKHLMKAIYQEARSSGMHVDHIVPLVSKIVCGLHCEANLQLMKPELNMAKGNRKWPDMP